MRVETAIELVRELVYRPGWRLTAEDHTRRFEGAITLRVDYPAYNSNRDDAAEGYPNLIETYAVFPVVVGDCDDAVTLYRRVIDRLLEIEAHEAREFLRVRPSLWAPFHPHQVDGMRRWRTTQSASDDDLRPDMQFGIA